MHTGSSLPRHVFLGCESGKPLAQQGGVKAAPIFIDGKKAMTLRGENISGQFKAIVEDYVKGRWG